MPLKYKRRIQSVALVIIRDTISSPYFLKNRKSLLACFKLSSLLLNVFQQRLVAAFFFAGQKGIIIIVFETRVLYLQMQKDISGMRKRRILLPANKPRRDNPEQNIQQLTCLAFQASRYLSPSPKGRKVNYCCWKKVIENCWRPSGSNPPIYHYYSWSNLFGYYNLLP